MDYEIFEQGISNLAKWFKKKLDGAQVDVYYKRLDYIPNKAFLDITQVVIDNVKPNPSLFPTINDLKSGWWAWQKDNPDLMARPKKEDCSECGGKGWLWFKAEDPFTKRQNEFLAACAVCKNYQVDIGHRRKVRTYTRANLEGQGCEVFPYAYKNTKTYADLDEMKADVGERITL